MCYTGSIENESTPITFNKTTAMYSKFANDIPGYPITLKPGDIINVVDFNNKYSSNVLEKFDSVDAYFAKYTTQGGAIAPIVDQEEQKNMLKYAVKEKIKSHRYLLYKLMLTGNSTLKYQPITKGTPQENNREKFYAQHLGPILEDIRAQRAQELRNSIAKQIKDSLQTIRFSTWDWLASKFSYFTTKK